MAAHHHGEDAGRDRGLPTGHLQPAAGADQRGGPRYWDRGLDSGQSPTNTIPADDARTAFGPPVGVAVSPATPLPRPTRSFRGDIRHATSGSVSQGWRTPTRSRPTCRPQGTWVVRDLPGRVRSDGPEGGHRIDPFVWTQHVAVLLGLPEYRRPRQQQRVHPGSRCSRCAGETRSPFLHRRVHSVQPGRPWGPMMLSRSTHPSSRCGWPRKAGRYPNSRHPGEVLGMPDRDMLDPVPQVMGLDVRERSFIGGENEIDGGVPVRVRHDLPASLVAFPDGDVSCARCN